MFTASRGQVATYLVAICLFSISFLVFLNASISFVITTIIGEHDNVGNAVGTLGFADELVAIVACPLWGLLSDHVGARSVCLLFPYRHCSFSDISRCAFWPTLLLASHSYFLSRLAM